jgi:hypothetical protein
MEKGMRFSGNEAEMDIYGGRNKEGESRRLFLWRNFKFSHLRLPCGDILLAIG